MVPTWPCNGQRALRAATECHPIAVRCYSWDIPGAVCWYWHSCSSQRKALDRACSLESVSKVAHLTMLHEQRPCQSHLFHPWQRRVPLHEPHAPACVYSWARPLVPCLKSNMDLDLWASDSYPHVCGQLPTRRSSGTYPHTSKLVQLWYKTFPPDQRGQVDMKWPTDWVIKPVPHDIVRRIRFWEIKISGTWFYIFVLNDK